MNSLITKNYNMKKTIYLSLAVAALIACNDKATHDAIVPTEAITTAFAKDFPDAKEVIWSNSNGYFIADFSRSISSTAPNSLQQTEAWYTANGECDLVETDYESISQIPQNVQDGANKWISDRLESHNQIFTIDDIDRIEREQGVYLYRIEAEHSGNDVEIDYDLFFNAEGVLVSEIVDLDEEDDDTYVPTPSEIQSYVDNNYTNAIILGVEIDREDGVSIYDVELIAGQTEGALESVEFSLEFSLETMEILREEAELKLSQVPESLQSALKAIAPLATDENIEIERVTVAGGEPTYEIDAEDGAEKLDDRVFKADGTEIAE